MYKIARTFVATALAAGLLAACNLALPAPIELDGGVFGLDGVQVTLTHDAAAVSTSEATATSFSGAINESFEVNLVDIPLALRNVFRVASVDEAIGLDVTLVATSDAVLPDSFTVSAASLSSVIVKKGVQTVFTGDFSTVPGGTMTFTQGACVASACAYSSSATVALVDISLTGTAADKLAKAILSSGQFTVTADFAVMVNPALPLDTSIAVVLVSLGAVLE